MIEETVHKVLVDFAKEHPEVLAIYKGSYPGDHPAVPHYHLLIESSNFSSRKLEKEIRDLDLQLFRNLKSGVWYWPIPPRKAKGFLFLKELLYSK